MQWADDCINAQSENAKLLSLLSAERDRFGKLECELKAEVDQHINKVRVEIVRRTLAEGKVIDLESKLSRYREALRKINTVRPVLEGQALLDAHEGKE